MSDQNKRIEDKIDMIVDRIGSIDSTLAVQAVELKEHIRRTVALEAKLEPVEKHVLYMNGALKGIGVLSVIAAFLFKVKELLGL